MKKSNFLLAMLIISIMVLTTNAEALPILDGSTSFSVPDKWDAIVNWEVYEPYDSDSLLGEISDYSYFYLIGNDGGSTLALTQFAIGNPFALPITDAGSDDEEGDVEPSSIAYGIFGAGYNFFDPLIEPGDESYILYLTSPYAPGFVSAGLQAPGYNDYQKVPPHMPKLLNFTLYDQLLNICSVTFVCFTHTASL